MSLATFTPKYLYALAHCLKLFSIGAFNKKDRGLIWRICEHYGYPVIKPQLPQVSPDLFLNEKVSIVLQNTEGQNGNVSVQELAILCAVASKCIMADIFEIGTFDGRTTKNLFYNLKNTQSNVYTLDLPREQLKDTKLDVGQDDVFYIDKEESGAHFKSTNTNRIKQLYGDSASFDITPFEGKMEMVFVDGSHAYEYVKNDAKLAVRMIAQSGGNIFFHDYGVWTGVTRALDELFLSDPAFRNLRHIKGTSLAWLSKTQGNS